MVAEIVEEQGLQPSGLALDAVVRNGAVDFAERRVNDAEDYDLLHTHQVFQPLWGMHGFVCANVVLFMILLDVPMQTRLGVMDEVTR